MVNKCMWCGVSQQTTEELLRHIQNEHAPKASPSKASSSTTTRHQCGECSRSYAAAKSLSRHVKEKHQGKKRNNRGKKSDKRNTYKCSKCSVQCSTLKELATHRKSHCQKLYKCRNCTKKFKAIQKLYIHRRSEHRQKYGRYKCNGCWRGFQTASMKLLHERACADRKNKAARYLKLRKRQFPHDQYIQTQWNSVIAVKGDARVHTLPVTDSFDLQLTLLKNKSRMLDVLNQDISQLRRIKWYLIAYVNCAVGVGESAESVEKYLRCSTITTLRSDTLSADLETSILGVINSFDKAQEEGSSMLFQRVEKLEVRVAKYSPLKGSSYLPLPKWLNKSSKGLINIQNFNDNKCFLWSCLAGLKVPPSHPERVAHYKHRSGELNLQGLNFPLKVHQIPKFEGQNPLLSVSVFGLETDTIIVPLYVPKIVKPNHINLLLLEEGDCSHYVLIKDISRFLSHLTNRKKKLFWCENCLTPRDNAMEHEAHRIKCVEQECQAIKLPKAQDKMMYFKDHGSRMKHDFVVYADLEAVLEPYHTAHPNPNQSNTTKTNRHVASGFCYVIVRADGSLLKAPVLHHGPDTMRRFLESLKDAEQEIMKLRGPVHPIDMTPETTRKFEEASMCDGCKQPLPRPGVLKVRDHDHTLPKNNYRGCMCGPCNLNMKRRNYIPVIMHNLSGYDSHHIISAIGEISNGNDISIIPKTKEKYVSFQWGNLRFLDSLGFLNSSLETLVKDLKPEEMSITRLIFPQREKFELVTRKGVYPYQFFDSFERFQEKCLPPRAAFMNDLTGKKVSDVDYAHACKVFRTFNMSSLYDYHDLYLLTDVLLLSDVMENYRASSLSQFQLDVVHYYTTPGFAWSAALSYTGQKLELLTDLDMHLFFEKAIRGGVSCISGRYSEANNKLIPESYNPDKPSSYIMYYDCNALYATSMSRKLPIGGFRFLSHEEISKFDIMSTNQDDSIGFLIECDLEYPDEVHDAHNDYPLAPEHKIPLYDDLSKIQKQMIEEYGLPKTSNVKKLIPNLHAKKNYHVYSSTLKLYLQLGLKLTKIHRVLEFQQEDWLAPFVHHNIEMRKKATSDFQKAFFKLLNNATYGKTIESVRKRRNVVLTREQEKFRKLIKSPLYHSFEIFDNNLVAVERRKATVCLNRPIYTGVVILEISKQIMFDFHYNVMKAKYGRNISVLGTDTDSLIYHIVTPCVYSDMLELSKYFDTADYDKTHPVYSDKNRRKLGAFKDEMSGVAIQAFCGLKAKMYSFSTAGKGEKTVGKGIPKAALKAQLKFSDYKLCLEERNTKMVSFYKISTDQKHHLYQTYSSKRALSAYDDKRYILSDNKSTLAFGHYRLRGQENECCNHSAEDDDEEMLD